MANSITLEGRAVADAEVKYVGDKQSPVLKVRVASDVGYGEKKSVNWYGVELWGKGAESLGNFIVKGKQLFISGEEVQREYESNGQKRVAIDIKATTIRLIGSKDSSFSADTEDKPTKPVTYAPAAVDSSPF